MDTAPSERCIVIRIDGEGRLQWQHCGLSALEIIGLLETTKQFAFTDLSLQEAKAIADNALLRALKRVGHG